MATRGDLRRHQLDVHTMNNRLVSHSNLQSTSRGQPYQSHGRRGRSNRTSSQPYASETNTDAMLDIGEKIANSITVGKYCEETHAISLSFVHNFIVRN